MSVRRLAAILLLLVSALLVPVTTAQATTARRAPSACAPAAESQWWGTFSGPHQWTSGDGSTGVSEIEVTVYEDGGQLKIGRHGFVGWASTADGLLTMEEHPILGLAGFVHGFLSPSWPSPRT